MGFMKVRKMKKEIELQYVFPHKKYMVSIEEEIAPYFTDIKKEIVPCRECKYSCDMWCNKLCIKVGYGFFCALSERKVGELDD